MKTIIFAHFTLFTKYVETIKYTIVSVAKTGGQ